ncbi:hypothetical protein B0H17DRAFT_1141454 [Mycena rosella]|uniref:Uncharacterized protein n=1 Tax=Mycena rosella TaxID=1033263 RepID=A0AAD7G914_MYCRO|nr:hypothetical protein B0H17DRAFT_1141454 [Mycena rosella]
MSGRFGQAAPAPCRTSALGIDTLLKASGYFKLLRDRMPLCPHSFNPRRSLDDCRMVIHRTQHDIYGTVMYLQANKHEFTFLGELGCCPFYCFPSSRLAAGVKGQPGGPPLTGTQHLTPGTQKSLRLLLPLIYLLPALALRPNIGTCQLRSGGLYAPAIALGALKLHHLDFAYYTDDDERHTVGDVPHICQRAGRLPALRVVLYSRRLRTASIPAIDIHNYSLLKGLCQKAIGIQDASANTFTYGPLGIALLGLNSSVGLPNRIWQAVQTAIRSCPSRAPSTCMLTTWVKTVVVLSWLPVPPPAHH